MAANNMDPEKGILSTTTHAMMPSSSSSAPEDGQLDKSGSHSPLQVFQVLIGIHTPPDLTQDGVNVTRVNKATSRKVRSDNIGLYQRARQRARSSKISYLCTCYISNILYIFQILLAATFTALSGYKDTHAITLTVLGALNTFVAGCLAWSRGQGVPQRYRKAQDQYQALVLDIEMTERAFMALEIDNGKGSPIKLDPRVEEARLQKLYDTARADQQANYPDLYISTGSNPARDNKDLNKQLEDAKAEAAKVQADLMAKVEALMSKLETRVGARVDDVIRSVEKAKLP